MNDYTLVCGVDRKHLEQLSHTWPTWKRHKPSILDRLMVVFFDREQVTEEDVRTVVDHPSLVALPWPPEFVSYDGTENREKTDKWDDPQREKMLTGFVFTAAQVRTKYWLKLDTDVVAVGNDDWIDPEWFDGDPAIVSHGWSFTKPPDQMLKLDAWVAEHSALLPSVAEHPPLELVPKDGRSRLGHKRIISWCAFFSTEFTKFCAQSAYFVDGYKLPVPSQDGFMWYMAKRTGRGIKRTNMKSRGWQHWSTMGNVIKRSAEAMQK